MTSYKWIAFGAFVDGAPLSQQYLDFDHVKQDGSPLGLKGTVCIHEQDEGIGWKHTNFRTGNPSVTRSRVLVVQSMITVYVSEGKL